MKNIPLIIWLMFFAGCATLPTWQKSYSAPYNTAPSEEQARIWKKTDDVFADRADFLAQGKIEGERVEPKLVARPAPIVPLELRKEKGMVLVGFMIERDGSIRDARVLESGNPLLDPIAVATLKKWRFTPGTAGGEPRIVRCVQEFEFTGQTEEVGLKK